MGKNNQEKIKEAILAIKDAYEHIDKLNGALCELEEEYGRNNIALNESEAETIFNQIYMPLPTGDMLDIALEILKDSYSRTGEEFTCGNCGKVGLYEPAISRKDNKTLLCSDCGLSEAMESLK